MLACLSLCASILHAQEPYAVLSDNNRVLTFYYDTQKAERGGMDVGPFESDSDVSWNDKRTYITTVVFDASFAECISLTSTAYWFYLCGQLTTITGIENLKTDNVMDMSNMFSLCFSLKNLDVSGFKTDNVTSMSCMFYYCKSLSTIYTGDGWTTKEVTDGEEMFSGCTNIVGGEGTIYDESHTDHTYARIDGGVDAPGYFTYKEVVSVKAGDVNGDGAVDVADIASVISEMAKSDDPEDPDPNPDDQNKGAMTAVDLGLSVKWAADDYYGIHSPGLKVDGGWRLPTQKECQELIDNCPSVWTYKNGVPGRKFTAANGNSIFLSANYSWENLTLDTKFDPIVSSPEGRYWTSDHSPSPYFDDVYCWMYIGEDGVDAQTCWTSYLYTICTVRLVHK